MNVKASIIGAAGTETMVITAENTWMLQETLKAMSTAFNWQWEIGYKGETEFISHVGTVGQWEHGFLGTVVVTSLED